MKSSIFSLSVFIFLMLLLPISFTSISFPSKGSAVIKFLHVPIEINSDDDFTPENGVIDGNGSREAPYVIANWLIYANNTTGVAIYNVSKHFMLANVTIIGNRQHTGIYIDVGIDQRVNVVDCTISNCSVGISITVSADGRDKKHRNFTEETGEVYIANNTVVENSHGISVDGGKIENNTIAYNDGTGLWLGGGEVYHNRIVCNNGKGVFVYYGATVIGNEISNNTGHGVQISENMSLPTGFSEIGNNRISGNGGCGVYLPFLEGGALTPYKLRIWSNVIENNSGCGIQIENLSWPFSENPLERIIWGNTLNNNSYGLKIVNCSRLCIFNNRITSNREYGIELEDFRSYGTYKITVALNAFWGNVHQSAQYNGKEIDWSISCEGNYWSDWQSPDNNHDGIVDLPYEIGGDAGAKDYYPLTYIPRGEPTAPLELNASASNGFVYLDWKEPFYSGASDITHYNIYRATEPEAWEHIGNSSALNYTDRNVSNGITYYYYVTAMNSNGESRKSNIVNATPGEYPGVPENVFAIGYENKIVLRWQPPGESGGLPITGYEISRSTFPNWQADYVRVGNVTEFVDMDVAENTTYYYRIAAVNEKGSGAQSGVVQATTTRLNVSLVAGKGVLGNGENTTITVYVERNGTHEPMANAYVVLSMVNLTGMLEKTEGYTNESGIFTTTFVAGTVINREEGVLKATVFCANYSVVSNSTRITLLPAPKERHMSIVLEADGNVKEGKWKSCVQVLDAENGVGIPNATVELRIDRYGIVVEKTTDGQGKVCFELSFSQGEPGFEVEVEIVAKKAGYVNASITVRTVLEFEVRQEPTNLVFGIAAGIAVAGAIAAFVVWKKRRREVRKY
ncbi:MAG: NosD domain-containing protein [Thermoplasmata archaeon]